MKNTLKKLGALVLVVVMMMSLSVAAFADGENTGSSDYNGNTGHPYAQQDDNTFSIKKEIVLFNVDQSSIFDPNVVYSYSVSPVDVADGESTVTGYVLNDNTKPLTTAVVRDGVAGAVTIQGRKVDQYEDTTASADHAVTGAAGTTTTLTFGGDNGSKLATLKEGTTVASDTTQVTTGYIDVSIDAATIYAANKGPGIYRYKISDTTTAATLTASGIQRDDNYVADLFLDVYVKNNSNDPVDGFEVYGYVLFKNDNKDIDILFADGTDEAIKVDGYTVLSEVTKADQYHTYNVEVSKTTTGDLADKRNNFPFQVDLTNAVITSQDDFYYVITKDGAQTEVTTKLAADGSKTIGAATAAGADNLQLQDGDKILITGLPVSSKIDVTEFNNTFDVYTASAKDEEAAVLNLDNNAATPATDAATVIVEHGKTGSLHAAKDIDNTAAKDVVAFTNTLETISPTGVVLRVAPYALMLGAGLFLFFFSRRRKAQEEA